MNFKISFAAFETELESFLSSKTKNIVLMERVGGAGPQVPGQRDEVQEQRGQAGKHYVS